MCLPIHGTLGASLSRVLWRRLTNCPVSTTTSSQIHTSRILWSFHQHCKPLTLTIAHGRLLPSFPNDSAMLKMSFPSLSVIDFGR
ncbi:hypothetical protein AHF37_10150 [Paragonimus kellicotti]|nr:hypothetical protein AHF37_10150 [Paragonimus kellicotti]